MRLCTRASLCLAAAVAVLAGAAPAHAAAPLPACASEEDHSFPLTARIHGGPASYTAGGGFGTWWLELTNTTRHPCTGVHPVVVLVDAKRALRPSQPRLEFYDGRRPHPVRFEATDRDELVGAFADEDAGFAGFTIAPGRTLGVKVRLALTSDAVPNEVTANAAVVQRRDDDGDWVGQSDDYRFRIEAGAPTTAPPTAPSPGPATPSAATPSAATPTAPTSSAATPSAPTSSAAIPSAGTTPGAVPADPGGGLPPAFAGELAGTGRDRVAAALAGAAALLVTGGTAVALARTRGRR
ncbi:hypothetical protein ACF1AE_03030 [Streptomyces sp. NPDC014986]|uniref:hypothetical protein n=1 Tax=Streptomyces sp. NPDC014986 TaxID=3364934 RepID=UPI0036FB4127